MNATSLSASRVSLALLGVSILSPLAHAQPIVPSAPGLRAPVPSQSLLTPEQAEILSHLSIVYLDDGQGGTVKTIQITGVNVRIINGLGATNGLVADPDSTQPAETVVNGLGNLIVGYNEPGNPNGDDRTGSHNIVVGHGHSYSSFGGLVAAQDNTISGAFATVGGGGRNVASGRESVVSGGSYGTASGSSSAVGGGGMNTASGGVSSVSGGQSNGATGLYSSIIGGANNCAGHTASVSGGRGNCASGYLSSISGGRWNSTSGYYSSISGGSSNRATDRNSSVSGGRKNTAYGRYASVSGGDQRSAMGKFSWVAGTLLESN